MSRSTTTERVVRMSFGWLAVGATVIILFGVLGGILAQQFWPTRPPLVAQDAGQLVTTVQEVTISPNTATTDLVEKTQRSVILISRASESVVTPVATGVVVTNDGLVVTADVVPEATLIGFDYQGKSMELDVVGRDELFGLSYLRVRDGILLPLDLRVSTVPVGYELTGIDRSGTTFWPRVMPFRVLEVMLPPELLPRGVQYVLWGTTISEKQLAGSPLLDEDGKLAGILTNPAAGLALPADLIRESLNRVSGGKREANILTDVGLGVRYAFAQLPGEETRQFVVEVTQVTPGSPAAALQVKRGDLITSIGDQVVEWNTSVINQISNTEPLTLTVSRAGIETTLAPPAEN